MTCFESNGGPDRSRAVPSAGAIVWQNETGDGCWVSRKGLALSHCCISDWVDLSWLHFVASEVASWELARGADDFL